MQARAQKAADHIKKCLELSFAKYKNVYLATHVPPWREASVYNGAMSDKNWLPFFSSKVMGDTIEAFMKNCSGKLTVLCGHSHGYAKNQIANNIVCLTGGARYGEPKISEIFDIE
jgi:Icc protein